MSDHVPRCSVCSSTRLRQHCGRFACRRGWVRCVDCRAFGTADGPMTTPVPAADPGEQTMTTRRSLWQREPVRVAAAFAALVNLAVSFGVELTADQVTNLNVTLLAVMALWVRRQVTPIPAESPPAVTPPA